MIDPRKSRVRLSQLIRLLRGSRLFKHWEMRLHINYQVLELLSLTVFILIFCHWSVPISCSIQIERSADPMAARPVCEQAL